jgi:hypothetical protein
VILPKDRDPRFITIRRGGTLTDSDVVAQVASGAGGRTRGGWIARAHSSDWLALPVLLAGTFMIVLDFFIVNVTVPAMQRDLHAGATAIEWVVACGGPKPGSAVNGAGM